MNILKAVGVVIVVGAVGYVGVQLVSAYYEPLSWLAPTLNEKAAYAVGYLVSTPLGLITGAVTAGVTIFKGMSSKLTTAKAQSNNTLAAVEGQAEQMSSEYEKTVSGLTTDKETLTAQLNKTTENFEAYKDSTQDIVSQNASLTAENKSLVAQLHDAEIRAKESAITLLNERTPTLT